MKEAIEQDPNNPALYFNLGVVSKNNGNFEDAESYYKMSIDVDPSYLNSYYNLIELKIDSTNSFREEMGALGFSKEDETKFNQLNDKIKQAYRDTIPLLEYLISVNNDELDIKQLINIYNALEMYEESAKLKELLPVN